MTADYEVSAEALGTRLLDADQPLRILRRLSDGSYLLEDWRGNAALFQASEIPLPKYRKDETL